MSAKILAFQGKPETTLQEHIDELVTRMVSNDLGEFAGNLATARDMWRQYPKLVTAPELPEHLRGPFIKTYGYDPDTVSGDCGAPVIPSKQMRKFRREAEELARAKHPEAV